MDEPFLFNTTFPSSEYLNHYIPDNYSGLTMYGYRVGRFINYFSGSLVQYITTASSKVLDDYGISACHAGNYKIVDLELYNNTITSGSFDTAYTISVYNFLVGWKILSYYSGSTVGNVSALSLSAFTGLSS
jgi:hypothetical protein